MGGIWSRRHAASRGAGRDRRAGRAWQEEEITLSVMMTLRVEGDGVAVEKFAAEDPAIFKDIIPKAMKRGLISHHFYASDREILVVDEWPSAEAFHGFFDDAGPQIQQIMNRAGVTSEPVITFWHKLETGDDVG